MSADLSPAKRRERAYIDREEQLTDKLATGDWHAALHYRIGSRITLRCGCSAQKVDNSDDDGARIEWEWDDEIVCPEHNPRGPIDVYFDTTPRLWVAIRREQYDGPGSPTGTGRTRETAIRELEDAEDAREEMRAARRVA